MFSIHERERVRERLLDRARTDARIVAAAAVGSLAVDEGDDSSDLDLMFAVSDNDLSDVVESWTQFVIADVVAVHLFDLPSGPILYGVFLLPDGLELDLSFVPASEFRPGGPKFKLLFGEALERTKEPPADAQELFGYAVHHVLHARAAIERGRYWQAEYWISAVRDHALMLACLSRGLDGSYGRDFDRLPVDVRDLATASLVGSLTRDELDRALGTAVAALLRESAPAGELVEKVSAQLHQAASGRSSIPETDGGGCADCFPLRARNTYSASAAFGWRPMTAVATLLPPPRDPPEERALLLSDQAPARRPVCALEHVS